MTPEGKCACRLGASCKRPGQHPAVLWRELEEGHAVPLPAPGAGYGIKTGARPRGSGLVVIDLDGEGAVDAWLALGGSDETYTVKTGRGLHLYFQHPGFHVTTNSGVLAPKIDVRGDGGFVVGGGSPHRSGAVYEVLDDRTPAPLPGWLRTWFQKQPTREAVQPHPEDVEGPERERRRDIYAQWLESEAPPCVAGQSGDQTLFKVVQKGAYDLALPTEDVLELVAEHYDHRCDPPWGEDLEERVIHKAKSAKSTSIRPRNPPLSVEEEAAMAEVGVLGGSTAKLEIEPTRHPAVEEPAPEKDAGQYGFRVQWGGWQGQPVPPDYLVHNLLVEGKVSMIFAEPGTIKSWTAIDLAACVASGQSWLGERHVEHGPVLYVDFEDGQYEFHRRVHLLTGGAARPGLGYVYAPGNIVDRDWWVRLEKLVLDRGVKLVVIDTLAGATPGVDENDRNAADPLTYAGRLTETTGVTVLFLHHANRAGDIRGTSAFKATVDTLFKLETTDDDQDTGTHRAKLTCVKSGQKKVPPVWLELTDDGLRRYEPEPEKGKPEGEEGEKKRTRTELERDILLLIENEGPIASVETIRSVVKARTSNVNAAVAELLAAGRIYRSAEGWCRDSDGSREERLCRAVQGNPGWGKKALVAAACVAPEFFDRCVREKWLAEAVVGSKEDGYVWRGRGET